MPALLLLFALGWTLASGPPSLFATGENALLRWLLLLIPWALNTSRADLRRLAGNPTRRQLGVLALIVGVGAALRFGLTPLPFHANNWMDDLVGRVAAEPEPAWYANGYGVFMRLLTLAGLSPERALFAGNQVAGTLVPLAAFAAASALFGDAVLGLWAALLSAVLPVHVRLSASEGMQIIPTLFLLVGVAGFSGHARLGHRLLLLAGIAGFTYAVLTRIDAAVTAIGLPVLYASQEARKHLRDPWLAGGIALALVVGLPLALAGIRNHDVSLTSPAHATHAFLESLRIGGTPHGVLAILGFAGLGVLIARRRGWYALFLLIVFASTVEVSAWDMNRANRLQMLCAQLPWLVLGAAVIPAMLPRPLIFLTVASLIAPFAERRALIFGLTWDQHQEWTFLHRGLSELGSTLVRPGRTDCPQGDPPRSPSLPSYLVPPATQVWDVSDLLAGEVALPATYYRAPTCYRAHSRTDGSSGLEPWCAAVEERYRLTPLATTTLDAPPYWSTEHLPPIEIGFFRLEQR